MIAYLDSSVILRVILSQKKALSEFNKIKKPISSVIMRTECLRVLDRLRLTKGLSETAFIRAVTDFHELCSAIDLIRLTTGILNRAAASMPLALGTLDAIHLCSASVWSESYRQTPIFLTHDKQLGKAASVHGFQILGV